MEKLTAYTNKLSTGKRINSASDDASGLQISTRMTAQNNGNAQAIRNIQDGISLLQTTDGSLATIQDMLQRARELSVQGKNGTYSTEQKKSIENEIKQILEGVNGITKTTKFNGVPLLTDGKSAHLSGVKTDEQRVVIKDVPVDTTAGAKTTVEFWMYWRGINDDTHETQKVFGWDDRYNLYMSDKDFGINTGNTDRIGLYTEDLVNKWVHVAAVFVNGEVNKDTVQMYINGEKVEMQDTGTNTTPSGVNRTVSSNVHLGGWGSSYTYDFNGYIDELKIWNGERTEDEIKEGKHKTLTGNEDNLLGYWKINDENITDESIHGNNGELLNDAAIGEGVTEPVKIHTGYSSSNEDWVGLPSISTNVLNLENIDLEDPNILKKIDKAIDTISEQRGYLGAKINRYEFKIDNLQNTINNTEAAQMRIEDLDMAYAMSELAKTDILAKSTQQMLKMNNQMYQQKMEMLIS